MKCTLLIMALGLTACVSDPKSGNNSSDVTICVISVCNQNHLSGEGDGNEQKSDAGAEVSAEIPIPAP